MKYCIISILTFLVYEVMCFVNEDTMCTKSALEADHWKNPSQKCSKRSLKESNMNLKSIPGKYAWVFLILNYPESVWILSFATSFRKFSF